MKKLLIILLVLSISLFFIACPKPVQYELTVTFSNATVTADGNEMTSGEAMEFEEGSEVELEVTPDSGYVFDGWSGDLTGTDNPATVTMDANKSITAEVSEDEPPVQYDLTVTFSNATVTANGDDLTSGTPMTFDENTSVTLEVTADTNYEFTEWTGDLTGTDNPATITMDADKNITAVVDPTGTTYDLTVTFTNGSVTANGNDLTSGTPMTFPENTSVNLEATADTGYVFVDWTGDYVGTDNPTTITMDADKNITAAFSINVTVDTTEILTTEFGTWIAGDISQDYEIDEYYFTTQIGYIYRVSVDDNSSSSYDGINTPDPTIDTDHKMYKMAGAGNPDDNTNDYVYNEAYDATVISGWYDSDYGNNQYVQSVAEETTVYSAVRDYSFNGGTGIYYIMVEEFPTYQVSTTISPAQAETDGATVTGDGYFVDGASVSLQASGAGDWVFVEWQDTLGNQVSTDNPYDFTIASADVDLVAVFEQQVTIWSDDFETGVVDPNWSNIFIGSDPDFTGDGYGVISTDGEGYGDTGYALKFDGFTGSYVRKIKVFDINVVNPVTVNFKYKVVSTNSYTGIDVYDTDRATSAVFSDKNGDTGGWISGTFTLSTAGDHEVSIEAYNSSDTAMEMYLDNIQILGQTAGDASMIDPAGIIGDISISYDLNTLPSDGSSYDLGVLNAGVDVPLTFEVTHTEGKGGLSVSGITVNNTSGTAYSAANPTTLTVYGGTPETFDITFNSTDATGLTADVSVVSNGITTPYNFGLTADAVSPPPVPTAVSASVVGSEVEIQWTGDVTAYGYNVYVATVPGGPYSQANVALILEDGSGTYTWSDNQTGYAPWETYYYVVTSETSGGVESAFSSETSGHNPVTTMTGTLGSSYTDNEGDLLVAGQIDWWEFTVIDATVYDVSHNDSWDGDGTYTADIEMTIYDASGNVLLNDQDSSYTAPVTITTAGTTIYVQVYAYTSGSPGDGFSTGTYGYYINQQ